MAILSLDTLALHYQSVTDCSRARATLEALNYVTACYRQLLKHITKHDNTNYYVSMDTIRRELGDHTVAGVRYYPFNVFQTGKSRILTPVTIGNNISGRLTMTKLNYDFDQMEQIITASGNANELVDYLYNVDGLTAVDALRCEMVPIDIKSLEAFLLGNANIERDGSPRAKKAELYALYARRILMIAEVNDGAMPHFPRESPFGRKYYHGPNLQNTPKIVRHAALGTCHEYDIESSVFAWKLSLVRQICGELGEGAFSAPATLQYLDYKSATRKQICRAVFDTTGVGYVEYIKQAITALGFGAPLRAGGYKTDGKWEPLALSECIRSSERLNRFLTNAWVVDFASEQTAMNDIIIEYALANGMEDTLREVPDMVNGRGRLKPNSVISYLYQQSERQILSIMTELSSSRDVLLTIHDCFYTRVPVELREVRHALKQVGEFFDISHEQHRAFAYDTEAEEHKRFIRSEEQRVASATGKPVHDPVNDYNPVKAILEFQDNYRGDWDAHDGKCYDGSNRNESYSMANYDRELDPWFDGEE